MLLFLLLLLVLFEDTPISSLFTFSVITSPLNKECFPLFAAAPSVHRDAADDDVDAAVPAPTALIVAAAAEDDFDDTDDPTATTLASLLVSSSLATGGGRFIVLNVDVACEYFSTPTSALISPFNVSSSPHTSSASRCHR